MNTNDSLRISLELESASDPIRGRLYDQGSEARPFAGWLGLLGALEAALAPHTTQTDPPKPGGTPRERA